MIIISALTVWCLYSYANAGAVVLSCRYVSFSNKRLVCFKMCTILYTQIEDRSWRYCFFVGFFAGWRMLKGMLECWDISTCTCQGNCSFNVFRDVLTVWKVNRFMGFISSKMGAWSWIKNLLFFYWLTF